MDGERDNQESQLVSDKERENVRDIAHDMIVGFEWHRTNEGEAFWTDIYNRLLRIAEKGK